jgi:hypothetical protein
MGNYEVVDARQLWPDFQPDRLGFAPWRAWERERLLRRGDDPVVAATNDETDLTRADYDTQGPPHGRYQGPPATHYWRTADDDGVLVRVNGRTTYWADGGPISGGMTYENFELQVPFAQGGSCDSVCPRKGRRS